MAIRHDGDNKGIKDSDCAPYLMCPDTTDAKTQDTMLGAPTDSLPRHYAESPNAFAEG